MRVYQLILPFVFLFIGLQSSYSQDYLKNNVNLQLNGLTADSVIQRISEAANVNFSFSHDQIDSDKIIDFSSENLKVSEAVRELCKKLDIDYLYLKKQIILKPKKVNTDGIDDKEKFTISGYVKDKKSGEIQIGSAIYIPEIENGAVTNTYGFYSITLPEGTYNLRVSSIGFNTLNETLELNKNIKLDFKLESSLMKLDEVEIIASEKQDEKLVGHLDKVSLSPNSLVGLSRNFGEVEVIKSLNNIPGINSHGDGSVFFYVRGGNKDQNLILLDEAPIYNPSHMLGFFSSFSPDAIKNVDIYKSDIPSSKGGMLSSVIDIQTKDGNMFQTGGYINLSPIVNTFSLEGPLWENKISYYLSFRNSHLHRYFGENIPMMYFRDFNLKLNYKVNENNRIYVTSYTGRDDFGQRIYSTNRVGRTVFTGFYEEGSFGWGNESFTVRWNHLFSDKLFSNLTFYGSNYSYDVKFEDTLGINWEERIQNRSLKMDFTYYKNDRTNYRFGAQVKSHFFNPGNITLGQSDGTVRQDLLNLPQVPMKQSGLFNLYCDRDKKIGQKWNLSYGFRYHSWNNYGPTDEYIYDDNYQVIDTFTFGTDQTYFRIKDIAPRLSLSYQIDSFSFAKLSYDKTVQHLHLLSNSTSPFTTIELWVPSGPNIPRQFARSLTLGYYYKNRKGDLKFSSEVYVRGLHNQIDFADHPNLLMNPYLESSIRSGYGQAQGWENSIEKKFGPLTTKTSLNFSRSWRIIEGVNNDEWYPAVSDRPYDFNLQLTYQKHQKWIFGGQVISMSGMVFTSPTGFFNYQGSVVPYYAEKNNDRLPDYQRVDLYLTKKLNKNLDKRVQHEVTLSVYNILGTFNFYSVNFNQKLYANSISTPKDLIGQEEYISSAFGLGIMIPSINYSLRF